MKNFAKQLPRRQRAYIAFFNSIENVWVAAKEASEKDGKIVEKVESVYLTPLSFSKIK